MKSLKNFLSFKVPDNSAYEQRPYSEQFCSDERQRFRWRCLGAAASVLAVLFLVLMLLPGSHWCAARNGWSGLWDSCYLLPSNRTSSASSVSSASSSGWRVASASPSSSTASAAVPAVACSQRVPDWQKAIIGLLLFSVLFSAIGSVIAALGLCVSYLPRKMYYYHSAGEIFFVSALAATIAVGVYPYVVQRLQVRSHSYGYGYGLGWATAALLYFAAFTMMLDDLVRESSRPRPWAALCCCCPAARRGQYPQSV